MVYVNDIFLPLLHFIYSGVMFMIKIGVKAKLFLLLLTVLIPLIALQIFNIRSEYNEKLQSELETSEDYAEAIITTFTNYIYGLWQQQAMVGSRIASSPLMSAEVIPAYLQEIRQGQSAVSSIMWLSPDGIVIAADKTELIGKSLSAEYYIKEICAGENRVLSDLVQSSSNDVYSLIIARSVLKYDRLYGIVVSEINLNNLSHVLPDIRDSRESRFGIIDRNGLIVYDSSGSSDVIWHVTGVDGSGKDKQIMVYRPIDKLGWSCYVKTSYDKVMAEHIARSGNDCCMLALISLFSVLYTLVLGKMFEKKLFDINEAITIARDGDYSVRADTHGTDELSATARALNNMIDSISMSDRKKSQFYTNMSHELKTPLSVIFASTQMIETINQLNDNHSDREKIRRQLKHIKQNCYRLIKIINNIIDSTRFENGYLPIKMRNHNIISIVEEISLSVVKFAESKGISIIFDTDAEEKFMACDPDIIERIMLNLFSNALKFTDRNGTIFVSINGCEDKVIIKVRDTGIGIPANKQKFIFERFGQVDSSLSRNQEGSGIGLSLVKSLVEAHNGTIGVSSEPGKGTEFTIVFTVTLMPAESTEPSALDAGSDARGSGSGAHSLIEKINIEFSDIYSTNER